jgi:hypothetical protein
MRRRRLRVDGNRDSCHLRSGVEATDVPNPAEPWDFAPGCSEDSAELGLAQTSQIERRYERCTRWKCG